MVSYPVGVAEATCLPACPPPPTAEVLGKYLMLVPKVAVELLRVLGLVVAELALVGLQFVVLLYVLLQALVAGAREGALIAAENHSLQVPGQLGTAHFNGDNPLFCGNKRNGRWAVLLTASRRAFSGIQRDSPIQFGHFSVSCARTAPPPPPPNNIFLWDKWVF